MFDALPTPPSWMDDALCAETDPEIFFPEKGGSTAAAKRVCAACPVATECATYALENKIWDGVWGGVTERARRNISADLNRGKPRTAPAIREHGTPAGAMAHHRRGEKPCEACRVAANADKVARDAQRKTTAA